MAKELYQVFEWRQKASSSTTWTNDSRSFLTDRLVTSVSNSPGLDHGFESLHYTYSGGTVSGRYSGGDLINRPVFEVYNSFTGFSLPGESTGYQNRIWAMTNPSRPAINAPVFIAEARDIPEMIFQAGRALLAVKRGRNWRKVVNMAKPRNVAAANLAIQFGWRPLIQDLHAIATLQKSVDQRRKEIQRLSSPKGLKRRISISSNSKIHPRTLSELMLTLYGGSFQTFYSGEETFESWAVVRWRLRANQPYFSDPLRPSDPELRRLLLGLTAGNITEAVWEAIPWSWLVDWFLPIGSALAASNRVLAEAGSGTFMARRTWRRTYEKFPPNPTSWQFDQGTVTAKRHYRELLSMPSIIPSASVPILGPGQLSVLGSLNVLRTINPRAFT